MELVYFETVASSGFAEDIRGLLEQADREFIPPLSARGSSTQADLSSAEAVSQGAKAYYDTMSEQPVVLAVENGKCMGFMAFKENYICEYVKEQPNLYASTCVVHPDARGKGLMTGFYKRMIELYPGRSIFTRTWHTNFSHLHILDKLGFAEIARLKDHRGPGMDTVYFCRPGK